MANAKPNGLSKSTRHDKAKVLEKLRIELSSGKPLLKVLAEDKTLPSAVTFYDWINGDESFSRAYEKLREIGADALATECLAIADRHCETMVDVQHRRLMVDTRLRLLAKWQPKKYGDKLELSGSVETTLSPLEQLRQIHGARRGGGGGSGSQLAGKILDAELVDEKLGIPPGKRGELASQPAASQPAASQTIGESDCF